MLAAILLAAANAAAAVPCAGDCDESGEVSIADVERGVRVALGELAASECASLGVAGEAAVDDLVAAVRWLRNGCAAPASLAASDPPHNAAGVLRTAWLVLEPAAPIGVGELSGFTLECEGAEHPAAVTTLVGAGRPGAVVANPAGELPANAECLLSWTAPAGPERLAFRTAPAGAAVVALYDREDPRLVAPYPDDLLLVEDGATRTGLRLSMPVPEAPADVEVIFSALLAEANQLDGFAPYGHMVIELSAGLDPASLPRTPQQSLDPLATLGLFDLDPAGPNYGRRVPFRLDVRDDVTTRGLRSHTLVLFPSTPLAPEGRYALVLTRRAFADPGRPVESSPAFARVLGAAEEGEAEVVTRARAITGEVLAAIAAGTPAIEPDDVALAVRLSVRSTADIPRDMLAIREQILASPPPAFVVDSAAADPVAGAELIVVRGTWQAPDFRTGANLARDEEGLPVQTRARAVPFVLAIPASAATTPAPVTMHQHGNPGSMEEVLSNARRFLAAHGFATIGFTDILNREVAPSGSQADRITAQTVNVITNLLDNQKLPDHWVETRAEQVAFLRLIQSLGDLDVLPLGAPDGVPDLDLAAPLTYHGISEGANNGQGLLPYAPEIRAAALVVGGARLTETLIHQQSQAFLVQLPLIFPNIAPADIWTGFALFQAVFDVQDNHSHLPFLYRRPLPLGGTARRASVLVLEGLDDTLVPNHATNSMAWSLGPLPHVAPVQRDTGILEVVGAPLAGNIDAETTAGFYQYVPVGIAGIDPTPSCLAAGQTEGHFCPQIASESNLQRGTFLRTALTEAAPVIVDPLAETGGGAAGVPPQADDVAGAR